MVAFDNYLIGQSCLFEWVHCLQREYSADSNWNLAEGAFHLHLKILKLDHQTFPILLYRMDHQPVVYEIDNDKSKIFFLSIRRFWYHITCHKQLYTLFECTKLQHRIWHINNTIQICVVLEPREKKIINIKVKSLRKKFQMWKTILI